MADEFPIPAPAPAPTSSAVPVVPEAAPPAAEPLPTSAESPPAEPKHDDDAPLPKGVQRRIDRAVRQKYEAEARARVAEEELARMRQAPATTAPQPQKPAEETPTIDKFSNIEDYVTAKAQWVAREQIRQAMVENAQTVQQRQAQQETQRLTSSWQERVTATMAELPDFEEVLGGSEVPMSPVMGRAILESDVGPKLAYWLAQNPAEATKIAQLSPLRAVAALGRIEERLTAAPPPVPKVSSAPPPIEPVGSRASVAKNPDDMTTSEWLAWRRKQINSR